ncbi:Uu.00g146580.m01.CDS01 [Anthostomella pinea]|uniref:Uu.00g146580.m01.CDS01 n=1 Tax=Anthostomella pinea TaxID=933095 RepID=A0AAI8YLY2_9PEZI|nr:Uu.00g146580.m01.CDS01 [Anthostomella pinea]
MASVTSLGLHQPTALQYAIQEQLLPENPSSSLYEWDITVDHTPGNEGEDELLVTKDAVIWSRGCVFRKCFGFKLEKEPITQTLLTYFPTSEHTTELGATKSGFESGHGDRTLSRALVVFLKTQAHIYFLDGTSHVVHIPFEVETACAAPRGVIIQRRQRADNVAAASLKFPRVPPNSFISNPVSPVSVRASQQSTFTTETLGKPKALPLRLSSNFDTLWDAPAEKTDSRWPRLLALTDPLLELGLVVTKPERSAKNKSRKHFDKLPLFLDRAEEILHIEQIPQNGISTQRGNGKLILVVTTNRETSMYTVWRLSYLKNGDPFTGVGKAARRRSGPRRSSMQPGLPSGATTPVQINFKEPLGAPLPGKRSRKSEKVQKDDRALEKLESSLGIDKDIGVNRRSSRRVSSMLARADLSASQDRTGFTEQPQIPNYTSGRRDTSHGSQRNRTSGALSGPSFMGNYTHAGHSLGSFLEAPVDSLLEELRAGGDIEGFHSMGLDDHDFDGLAQEVMFTKIHSIPIDSSNVRYSLSKQPARKQCKVFCVTGPCVVVDELERQQVLVGIQDPMENRLQLLTLHLQSPKGDSSNPIDSSQTVVTFGQLKKAQNVIDASKIRDGDICMILMLSQAPDGQRQLSVQAPWSPFTPVMLPQKLSLANVRSLDYRGSLVNREVGIRRAVTPVIGELAGMRHSKLHGVVDILDEDTLQLHQIRIQLLPKSPQVRKILDVLRSVLPAPLMDNLIPGWWDIIAWLRDQQMDVVDIEWSSVVMQILLVYLALGVENPSVLGENPPKKRSRGFLRSSSGAQIDLGDWDAMNTYEAPGSLTHPPWAENKAWEWMLEEDDSSLGMFQPSLEKDNDDFLGSHAKHALAYLSSGYRGGVCGPREYLPTLPVFDKMSRTRHAQEVFLAMHLLLEEQKLNITSTRTTFPGSTDLRAVLLQIAKWMKWYQWEELYELEMPLDWPDDHRESGAVVFTLPPPEPAHWDVFDWIQINLSQGTTSRPLMPSISTSIPNSSIPRMSMLDKLFQNISPQSQSPTTFVEGMYQSGITPVVLESSPESVLVPLQDAIAQCQPSPPPTWAKGMLELVNRSDIGSVLSRSSSSHNHSANLLTPTHNASWDFNSLCQNIMDFNDAPVDDVAESDKQAVIRAIFKEDRRLDETKMMLNTTKPRSIRLDALPEWTEPFYLEQQKETVTRLATNTLSIPAGRALMNFGLRFPLLTQKFHIHGFVLNCTVRPSNVTVGVDKSLFTEDKIAWAFFHSGVAAGLSISRQAKGIDTSWILYNKPGNDLNNRHAGFLLALGLNGHLKGVAKWVAFKYLTPKHNMTSIGLLLGLAASYIGTMDSLITRLLSVHVTRMLPRGAAELNLSPLTQTTGIMGIGLLYCNSQHRRMSEIMMSEIEHIESEDDEEPLRSECYRLAAGFALGFINLGKGTDLKGLHDMRITEKLLTLASASKKVEHVHILDRSSAAAVMAIALIYMKSEDHIVARKIDVPDAALQFDYARPDILLLRTVARHLILWSEIEPSHEWICKNLPERYRSRVRPPTQPFDHPSREPLNSTHLPFLTILAGLCFSMALRFAGSGNLTVRDLLLSYLHRYYGLCRAPNPKANFDDRCVQVTARMCLDAVALSCATVMAGTCDLNVLRVLRSLHGRNDPQTTYGSHMATHMAIGVLSLGCGTQTFNTSNLAIASLLVAFYPVFPDTVQDNKSHLQAFRHFWVLATDPRCLVTKDVATNVPVSVPISIRLKTSSASTYNEVRTTPCLLPPLSEISSLRTRSPDFWNLELNFETHPEYADAFKRSQALHLRRRPISDSPFATTILALGRQDGVAGGAPTDNGTQPLEWLFDHVPTLRKLTHAEQSIVLDRGIGGPNVSDSAASVVDARLVLEEGVKSGRRDELLGLRGLFGWVEWRARRSQEDQSRLMDADPKAIVEDDIDWMGEGWLRESIIESLKGGVWLAGRE